MIFTENQLAFLKARAGFALIKVDEQKGQKDEWRKEPIFHALQEVCSMGYSIAMGEVCSTPWEYRCRFMTVDRESADYRTHATSLNIMADVGWEPFMACGSWLILRRRKAVGGIEAESKSS